MWRTDRASVSKPVDEGSRLGGATFETIQLCRRSLMVIILSKKFDIFRKITNRDVGNLVRHPDTVDLLHPFRVLNFSANFLYSVHGS